MGTPQRCNTVAEKQKNIKKLKTKMIKFEIYYSANKVLQKLKTTKGFQLITKTD